jgi:hypothetical protein
LHQSHPAPQTVNKVVGLVVGAMHAVGYRNLKLKHLNNMAGGKYNGMWRDDPE